MRPLLILTVTSMLLAAAANPAGATVHAVGPGETYTSIGAVPWESLAPGDSVLIHARPAPYPEKWVICRVGTMAQPIVVKGIPDAQGNLPVIDGAGATTRAALNFWNENRGVIKIGGANNPPDTMPAWIVVEDLEIRSARPQNTFTGRSGLTSYANNAAAIYIEKGQNIVIRGCVMHDCSNGFFCASQTTNLVVEGNHLHDNGNVGSIFEHNSYTEASGITFQWNRMGPMRAGSGGNNLKDRSAGTVIRNNWIEGGNRQLDLVDSGFAALINDPRYRETFVYGNILIERDADGNSQVAHYGGDSGDTSRYRKGTLHFHHNTVISERTGNTTLLRLSSSGEAADVRNNIVLVSAAAGNRLALLDAAGTLTATQNWFKTGWVHSHSGGAVGVIDNGQVTGSAPGFKDLAAYDLTLAAGSPCVDAGAALPAPVLPAHRPVLEYVKHRTTRTRLDDGMADLGAYELGSAVGVPVSPAEPVPRLLFAAPNPFSGRTLIASSGSGEASGAELHVTDVTGRQVAVLRADSSGRWAWAPGASVPRGLYLARSGRGDAAAKILYLGR